MVTTFFAALLLVSSSLFGITDAAYVKKTPRLTTPWTDKVDIDNPHPEYPRPQLVRSDWLSLNGQWEFAGATKETFDTPPLNQTLAETILVPFPMESAISGIMRYERYSFYRRSFKIPADWDAESNIQLNFGAVNWKAVAWVNGKKVGEHTGAYLPFSFDITDALVKGTSNELIVGVYSPVNSAEIGIPLGKQRIDPYHIYYTASSGIWASVFIEPTKKAHVIRIDTIADVPSSSISLDIHTLNADGLNITASVYSGTSIAKGAAKVGEKLVLKIKNPRLWGPDDPFLYDLKVTLSSGDEVTGYFGMRTVGTAFVNGFKRPLLNGRFIFQIGTLDQGYWPDGIYTAPTDEALRFDLEEQKRLGFNTVRKHIKVEPARWFYHTDRLGLIVFQDMPCFKNEAFSGNAEDRKNFEDEYRRMVDQLRGITSIVQWIPFNEGWGEYDEVRVTDMAVAHDKTRLINGNSGSSCCGRDPGNGHIVDDHIYVGPGVTNMPTKERVAQLGEFGGIGMRIEGHEWMPGKGFSYEMADTKEQFNKRYVETTGTLQGLIWSRGLSGSIYTEPVDVENELNGYYTYDRQVFKGDFDMLRNSHLAIRNSATWLRDGEYISLGVTTEGYTDRYLGHADSLGRTSTVTDEVKSRQDVTFRVRKGLASDKCWSFESRNNPGRYLRNSNSRVRLDAKDNSTAFGAESTFCLRPGGTTSGVAFEGFNKTGHFLRHRNGEVYVSKSGGSNTWDNGFMFQDDITWVVASPMYRSAANIEIGSRISLQAVTEGMTNNYLRHRDSVAITSELSSTSDALSRADATFIVRRGLADPGCFSFEASNAAGQYLRHSNFRIGIGSGSGVHFPMDATFCAQPGLGDSKAVTLWSYNVGNHAIRHYTGEVWAATTSGPKKQDNGYMYDQDASWKVVAALS